MSRMFRVMLVCGLFLSFLGFGLTAQAAQPEKAAQAVPAKKVGMERFEKYNQCLALCSNLKLNCEMSVPGPKPVAGQAVSDVRDFEERKHARCDPKVEECSAKCDELLN